MKPTQDMKDLVSLLVVDDDSMVRTIVTEYLMSFGFSRIQEAKNGRHAMKILNASGASFDIIISDWEMPEVDGHTFLKAVRNDPTKDMTKFIMVTSQSSQERFKISRAAKSRVDAYIVKPFRGDVLRAKIYELMGWEDERTQAS